MSTLTIVLPPYGSGTGTNAECLFPGFVRMHVDAIGKLKLRTRCLLDGTSEE